MVSILIVIDVAFYREGLSRMLMDRADTDIVGALGADEAALRVARERMPDVVLFDAGSPRAQSWIKELCQAPERPKLVALAVTDSVEDVLIWAEAGVTAYVTRDASLDELLRVVHGAARNEAYCSPQIAAGLMRRIGTLATEPAGRVTAIKTLTAREQEVLALLARGLSNKAIARELKLSIATVKNHVHNILDKMQLRNRAQAAALIPTGGGIQAI